MSELDDLKKEAVEKIYLIPDRDEGRLRYVWCDDPSPEYGMRDDDAVEYVRRDKYDALVAHIQALETAGEDVVLEACAVSQASMEWSRVLNSSPATSLARPKAEAERDALAAHVERLRERLSMCRHHANFSIGESDALALQLATIRHLANEALRDEPTTSLAAEGSWHDPTIRQVREMCEGLTGNQIRHALDGMLEPAPTPGGLMKVCSEYGMRDDEAVEYVRRDKYDALAAHVEALQSAGGRLHKYSNGRGGDWNSAIGEWCRLRKEAPTTSLAHIKAQCWKEAYLAGMEHGHHWTVEGGYIPDDEDAAEDYVSERQAEEDSIQ